MSAPSSTLRAAAKRWYDTMGVSRLHRAYVSLPDHMTAADRPLQERVVFFEVPDGAKPWEHLADLLMCAWGAKPCEQSGARGFDAYNISSARELFDENSSVGPLLHNTCDLRLFECAWGGTEGIGPEHAHYCRAADVDLFVTPHVAARLRAAMSEVERLYGDHESRAVEGGAL